MSGVEELDPSAARQLLDAGALLLDVREPDEWHEGHVPGAFPLPLGRVLREESSLPVERPIVVACRNGRRSILAAMYLAERGYDTMNLRGGLNAWAGAGMPLVRPDGTPGVVAEEES